MGSITAPGRLIEVAAPEIARKLSSDSVDGVLMPWFGVGARRLHLRQDGASLIDMFFNACNLSTMTLPGKVGPGKTFHRSRISVELYRCASCFLKESCNVGCGDVGLHQK